MQKRRKSTTKKSIPEARKSLSEDPKLIASGTTRSWDILARLVAIKARESKCGSDQYLYRYINHVQSLLQKRPMDISPLQFHCTGLEVNECKEAPSIDVNECIEPIPEDSDIKMEDDPPSNPADCEFVKRGRGRPRKDSVRNEKLIPGNLITSYFTTQTPSNVSPSFHNFPSNT